MAAWSGAPIAAFLTVSGADRATWLQGLLTNDVGSLKDGETVYAAYLTPQGRMISDMNVIERGGRILLDVPAPLAASLRDRLDGLIFSEDVQVTDESAALWVWTVIGTDGLDDIIGETLPAEFASLTPVEFDTFEVIRIERGVPRFLADMDEDTIPLEAGIEDRAISFTKGCYVGQEVIVRVTTRGGGRVAKKLVRWIADAVRRDRAVARREDRVVRQGHRPGHQRGLFADHQPRRRPRLRAPRFPHGRHGSHGGVE